MAFDPDRAAARAIRSDCARRVASRRGGSHVSRPSAVSQMSPSLHPTITPGLVPAPPVPPAHVRDRQVCGSVTTPLGRRLVRCVPDGTGMFRATQSSARPRREFCVAFLPVGSAHIRRDAGRVDPASQPGGITISTWRPSAFVLERETQSGARTAHDDATAEPKRTRVRHEVPMEPAAHSASSGDDRRTCFTRVAS